MAPQWTTPGLPLAFTGLHWEIGQWLKQCVLTRAKVRTMGSRGASLSVHELARRVLIRRIDGSDLANPHFMRKVEDHA